MDASSSPLLETPDLDLGSSPPWRLHQCRFVLVDCQKFRSYWNAPGMVGESSLDHTPAPVSPGAADPAGRARFVAGKHRCTSSTPYADVEAAPAIHSWV